MKQINLLPPAYQSNIRFLGLRYLASKIVKISAILIVLSALIVIGGELVSRRVIKMAKEKSAQLAMQESQSDYGRVQSEVKRVNNYIVDANAVFGKVPKLSRALEAVLSVIPRDITIQNWSLEATKKQFTIAGFSPTRQGVLDLHTQLFSRKEHFKQVDYPLENLARPVNVPFHFTVILADGVLE